jgi:hypothetical protein
MEDASANAPKLSVVGLVVCTFLAFDFITPQVVDGGEEFAMMVLVGICIGQINLIAVWAAFAPGNIVVRLPWSMLLVVLMWYGLVMGFRFETNYFSLDDAVVLGIVLLSGFVVLQIPLWIAARVFRWRLVSWDAPGIQAERGRSQFYLRHIMLGMVFLSLALAPARVVLPEGEIGGLHMDGELFVLLIALLICNIFVTIPCIWGAFLKWVVVAPVAVGWFVYCAILTGMEYVVLCEFLGAPSDDEVPFWIYLMNMTQCVTVFGTLLILRGLGFQLVRVASAKRPVYGKDSEVSGSDRVGRTGASADEGK